MAMDFDIEVKDKDEAERELRSVGKPGRRSRYEPVARKWRELGEDKSIVLRDLDENDIENLRNLLYRRFGKKNVIVRSAREEDGTFRAVVRAREGNEHLQSNG